MGILKIIPRFFSIILRYIICFNRMGIDEIYCDIRIRIDIDISLSSFGGSGGKGGREKRGKDLLKNTAKWNNKYHR